MYHNRTVQRLGVVAVCFTTLVATSAGYGAPQYEAARIQIVADGMCCQGCAQKIAAQLYTAPGVSNVEADVASHTVVVTIKPSPRLTLGTLWHATEKGDGKPSKLISPQAIYTLQRPEQLQLREPLAPGRYWVVVNKLTSQEGAANAAKHLQAIRGVKTVSCDAASRTFFIETATADPLSPWNLVSAIEQSGHSTESVTGPQGLFTVERPVPRAAQTFSSQQQGAVR